VGTGRGISVGDRAGTIERSHFEIGMSAEALRWSGGGGAKIGMSESDLALDYFAGSGTTGHAVINLNREDEGQRRFVLVEMGDHFDTVLLPRIKKATFTPEWSDGKPQRRATQEEAERGPKIVKRRSPAPGTSAVAGKAQAGRHPDRAPDSSP
jgi:hypothetical protein